MLEGYARLCYTGWHNEADQEACIVFAYFFTPAMFLPEGVGFALFGREHLVWLGVLSAMCVAMIFCYLHLSRAGRQSMARWVAFSLLALEAIRDGYIIACGAWEWIYLPLHPCSFTMFFMALWAWKPHPLWGNLMYGYGLVGAMCALLFCNWTNQPIWQFQTIYSFLFHGALVGWILMTLIGGDIRPEGRGFRDCVLFLLAAVPATAVLNNVLPECNFFFTHSGSEGSPLEFLIRIFGEPWWLGAYAVLALGLLGLEFLPWYILGRRKTEVRS